MALAQPVGGWEGCADLTVSETGDATQKEPNPDAPLHRISGQNTGVILMSQRGPRDLLNFTARKQLKETELLVVDPKIPRLVLNNGKHTPAAGNAAYRIKAVILKVAHAAKRSDPDSP